MQCPINESERLGLRAGAQIRLTGIIYTARDAAHKRLCEMIARGERLPFELTNQAIYYAGPCPPKPGQAIGSVGPTTSYRMDAYAPTLMENGLRIMIGKGQRSPAVIDAMKRTGSIYCAATGGAGALIASRVKRARVVAFEDLGPEAIRELYVEDFPLIVAIDSRGNDLYSSGPAMFVR